MNTNNNSKSQYTLNVKLLEEALKDQTFIKELTQALVDISNKANEIKSPKNAICRGQIWRDQHSSKREDRLVLILNLNGDRITCQSLKDRKVRDIRREQFGRGRTGYEYVADVQALNQMMQQELKRSPEQIVGLTDLQKGNRKSVDQLIIVS